MKRSSVMSMAAAAAVLAVALSALLTGCFEKSASSGANTTNILWSWHSAGRVELNKSTNATRLKEILDLPASADLRRHLGVKFASAAQQLWKKDLPAGAAGQGPLLAPLFEDLLSAEALVEVRGPVSRSETVVAVALDDARARLWSTNLLQAIAAWKLGASAAATDGWAVQRTSHPQSVQFARAGGWVLVGYGPEKLTLLPALAQKIKQAGRPVPALKDTVIDAQADLPALRAWVPLLATFPLPPADLKVLGRGEHLRTELKFTYSEPVKWRQEKWRLPTNIISEPLISFTAVRGVAPWITQAGLDRKLGINPVPNQYFAWGIAFTQEQVQAAFAFPTDKPAQLAQSMSGWVPHWITNTLGETFGKFQTTNNRTVARWTGIPFISPFLRVTPGWPANDGFVDGGLRPNSWWIKPPPEDLYRQFLNRTNLLYYDWELTDQRVMHGKQLYQLSSMMSHRAIPSTNTPSQRWISAAGRRLGNSVTEVAQTGPREFTLTRKSHVGFTGFELATLSVWLDSPGFPYDFQLPAVKRYTGTNQPPRKAASNNP
jgi:hypothetical protein